MAVLTVGTAECVGTRPLWRWQTTLFGGLAKCVGERDANTRTVKRKCFEKIFEEVHVLQDRVDLSRAGLGAGPRNTLNVQELFFFRLSNDFMNI